MPVKRKATKTHSSVATKKKKIAVVRTPEELKRQVTEQLEEIKRVNKCYLSQRYFDGTTHVDKHTPALPSVNPNLAIAIQKRGRLTPAELKQEIEMTQDNGCLVERFRKTLQLALVNTQLGAIASLLDLITGQTLSFQFGSKNCTPRASYFFDVPNVQLTREFHPSDISLDRTLFHVTYSAEPNGSDAFCYLHLGFDLWAHIGFRVDIPTNDEASTDIMDAEYFNSVGWTYIRFVEFYPANTREFSTNQLDCREDAYSWTNDNRVLGVDERADGMIAGKGQPIKNTISQMDLQFRASQF